MAFLTRCFSRLTQRRMMTHSNRFSERFEIMTKTMDFEVLKTRTKRQFYRNEPPRYTSGSTYNAPVPTPDMGVG